MSELALISIIVPVYNVERFLDKCMNSLINQTYSNIEIILIDDESTDSCPQKCDMWAIKDDRIRALHVKNGGVSVGRNIALSKARGKYISFVDSDDFVELNMIESMVCAANRNDSQIVFCGNTHEIYMEDGSYAYKGKSSSLSFFVNSKEEFQSIFPTLDKESFTRPVWNKLYRSDFLKKNAKRFSEQVTAGSDAIFNYELYPCVERAACIGSSLYHYVTREGSIAGKYNPRLFESRKYGYRYIRPILQSWCPKCLANFDNLFLKELGLIPVYLYSERKYSNSDRKKIIRKIVNDNEVKNYVRSIHPDGIRNVINSLVFKSSKVFLICMYGRSVSLLKRLVKHK